MRRFTVTRLSLLIGVAFAALRMAAPRGLELLDLKTVDLRHTVRGPLAAGGEIVIVAIDERSLSELGRWPWPRARLADLVDKLTAAGAAAIGFDLVFDQPERQVDWQVLRSAVQASPLRPAGEVFSALEAQLDGDRRLAASLQAADRVVLGHFFEFAGPPDAAATPAVPELSVRETAGADTGAVPTAARVHPNISALASAGWDLMKAKASAQPRTATVPKKRPAERSRRQNSRRVSA